MRSRAAAEDEGAISILMGISLAAVASLAGIAIELQGTAVAPEGKFARIALAGLTIWGLVNGVLVFNGVAELALVSLGLGLLGAAAVVVLAALLAKSDLFKPLRYCGENSIVIYLAFFLPMALSRMVLLKNQWITDVGTISALVTLAGVIGAPGSGRCGQPSCASCSSGRSGSGWCRKSGSYCSRPNSSVARIEP